MRVSGEHAVWKRGEKLHGGGDTMDTRAFLRHCGFVCMAMKGMKQHGVGFVSIVVWPAWWSGYRASWVGFRVLLHCLHA